MRSVQQPSVMMMKDHRHGNVCRTRPRKPDPESVSLITVSTSCVPFGESISRNGTFVWAVFEGERLVCAAGTAAEARRKYRERKRVGVQNVAGTSKSLIARHFLLR